MGDVSTSGTRLDFRPLPRADGAFKEPLAPSVIEALIMRATGVQPTVAQELGGGMYNTAYLVAVAGRDRPVVLRAAPAPGRQYRSERDLMRHEHAALPFLAPLGLLVPRTIAADFTREVVPRDWMVQEFLPGVPGPEAMGLHPQEQHAAIYRQVGEAAAVIHGVAGDRFGPVGGPGHAAWSAALVSYFTDVAADLEGAGLEAGDVRQVIRAAGRDAAALDEVTVPRLLHGDLWTANILVRDDGAGGLRVCGVLDHDRAWWGDPAADWTFWMAARKPRPAFWEGYGRRLPEGEAAARRALFYVARHLCAVRLERHRLGSGTTGQTYEDMAAVLREIG